MLRTESQHNIIGIQNTLRRVDKINTGKSNRWPPKNKDKHLTIGAQLEVCMKEIKLLTELVVECKV